MKTMLLVDDSRTVRLCGRRIVEPLGFNILEAENGAVALDVCRAHPEIDAILLDWNMPIMDGLTFLKTLRADPAGRRARVVMCTTENDIPRIMEAIAAGASEYVIKPFTEEIVKEKLTEAGVLS